MKLKIVLAASVALLVLSATACSQPAAVNTTTTTATKTTSKTTTAPPTTTAGASSIYTISGTISYSGTQPTGRVYIGVSDSNGTDLGIGLSVAGPQSYTIHSLPNGTYTLTAWMDVVTPQTGFPNALSPGGQLTVTVKDGNLSQQNIAIKDPDTIPSPTAPGNLVVSPGNGSILVQWSSPRDSYGDVAAQYYNVYYSTSSSVSPSTGTKKTIPVNNHIFITGLTDGTTYYFVVTSVLAGKESPPSPSASATAGAAKGSSTVSGAISFPGTATGPLYVGVSNPSGNFFQRVDKPVSPQTYSITGVPNGTYVFYVYIDSDNDGVIDSGDLNKTINSTDNGTVFVNVNGDTSENQALLATNALASVSTVHYGTSAGTDLYALQFEVTGNVKLPVNVTLISGPNILVPINMGGNYSFHLPENVNIKPKAGDQYTLTVSYSDGTSEDLKVSVTGFIDGFARNLTANGTIRTTPTFSWSAPVSPPSDYTYALQVVQSSSGLIWTYPSTGGMPSTQTSVSYNVDGTASVSSLQTGTKYDWVLYILDSNGNQSLYQTTYTP